MLPSDVIISDLLDKLGHPEDYVCRVLQTMTTQRREHGEVIVRIGILGTGHSPNYRIDSGESGEPIEAFDGANGNRFTDYGTIDTQNWSAKSMTFDQVQALLGQIRSVRR